MKTQLIHLRKHDNNRNAARMFPQDTPSCNKLFDAPCRIHTKYIGNLEMRFLRRTGTGS